MRYAVILAVLAAALAAILPRDTTGAVTYNPTLDYKWCNGLQANFPPSKLFTDQDLAGPDDDGDTIADCVDPDTGDPLALNPPANTAQNRTNEYVIPGTVGDPANPDANFSFGPATLTSSDHFVAADAEIPNGTKVGGFTSRIRIGILNGACVTPKEVDFILYDSETRNSNTVPVSPEDTTDRFAWQDAAMTTPLILDGDNDLMADADSPLILQNPDFYPPMFDPDLDYPGGPNGPLEIEPLARYTGATEMQGTWQVLSFFQFAPNSFTDFASDPDNSPHPLGKVGTQDYYLSLSIFNDPLATQMFVSYIDDYCTPLFTRVMLLGDTPTGCDVNAVPDPTEPPTGNSPYDQPCVRGKTPATAGTRIDLNADGSINVIDIGVFGSGFFPSSCT